MTTLCLGSVKGAPGVTTAALFLGAAWAAQREVLLAEMDPAGGDLACWWGVRPTPGLASLAAATRREQTPEIIRVHSRELFAGMSVLLGPPAAEQAEAALQVDALHEALTRRAVCDVVADCGRLDARSPALPMVAAADVLLVIVRPIPSDLAHVSARLPALRAMARDVALLLAGEGRFPADEVADVLEVDVLGVLPHDRHSANDARSGGALPSLSPLMRATRSLVRALATRLELDLGAPKARALKTYPMTSAEALRCT